MTETLDETEQGEEQQAAETAPEPEPEPETEPEEGDEGEEQQEEQVAPTQEEHEEKKQQAKKMQQAFVTYRNRLKTVMGQDFGDLSACPLCTDGVPAFLFPVEWITPETEIEARLLEVLRAPSAPEYKDAPNARRCGTCDGWGNVLSGSRVADKKIVKCPTCGGKGYQGEAEPGATAQAVNGSGELLPPDESVALVTDDTDIWGSPKVLDDGQDNPNYGKMPQYKNPSLP